MIMNRMALSQIVVKWTGWVGQPGYTTFNVEGNLITTDADNAAQRIKTLIGGWATYLPQTITLAVQPTYRVLDETTGIMTQEKALGVVPSDTLGASGLAYGAVAGFNITWRTSDVSTRKLRVGRTFVVPVTGAAFQTDGTLLDTARTFLQTAANTYVGGVAVGSPGHPVVWKRPSKGGSDGHTSQVTSATINDRSSFLRSRRQ